MGGGVINERINKWGGRVINERVNNERVNRLNQD